MTFVFTFSKKYLVWFCFLWHVSALGQKITISGYVKDATNGENLVGATVVDEASRRGATTNSFGFYSLQTEGKVALVFSYVGYQRITIYQEMKTDTLLSIFLQPLLLDEMIVHGKSDSSSVVRVGGSVHIQVDQIQKQPAFMGEVDIMKSIQLIPGVQGTTEGMAQITVRGGGPDQNLVLLDGVPVYNSAHLYGFFSAFNADAIQSIELFKGAFPARYSGRSSSVLNVTMREGNMKKHCASASIGLISAKVLLEGPIKKDEASYLVSLRRSYINLLQSKLTGQLGNGLTDGYYFYDVNAKINQLIGKRDRLYASFYQGRDKAFSTFNSEIIDSASVNEINSYSTVETANVGWGNRISAIRWNHLFNSRLFMNATALVSNYQLAINNSLMDIEKELVTGYSTEKYYKYQYQSGIREFSGKVDFEWTASSSHYLRFGGFVSERTFTPGVVAASSNQPIGDVALPSQIQNTNEINLYIEDEWWLSPLFRVNAGVSSSIFRVSGRDYLSAQPRFGVTYELANQLSAQLSYSQMQQFMHLLTNGGVGLPTDLWVPSTKFVKPQKADQWSVTLSKNISRNVGLSVESYYKKMWNLLEYKDGASYLDEDTDWQKKVEIGWGRSYGVEFLMQKKKGRLTGWLGYALSKSERQFAQINKGTWFPYRFDRRHDAKVTFNYRINSLFDIGGTWVYQTGLAVSVPLEYYVGTYSTSADNPSKELEINIPHLSSRNNLRMSAYNRLDLTTRLTLATKSITHQIALSVYNAYDRANPFYIRSVSTPYGIRLKQVSLFPVMPALQYTLKF